MPLEQRQLDLLRALVQTEDRLKVEGRPTEFVLLRMAGARPGLKPGIANEADLQPTEADIRDLEGEGYVHRLSSTSRSVILKFAVSASGKEAGRPRAVKRLESNTDETAPPSSDAVLRWLAGLEESGSGSAILADGAALLNEALALFGEAHLPSVARRLYDLRSDGLLLFDDVAASLQQLSELDGVGMARHFRLSSAGRDRASPGSPPTANVTQVIHAAQAQVAGGDITNYVSFEQLLDRADRELESMQGVDEEVRAEARGMLDKLRDASGTVATGTATGGAGTLLGAVLKQLLGLP